MHTILLGGGRPHSEPTKKKVARRSMFRQKNWEPLQCYNCNNIQNKKQCSDERDESINKCKRQNGSHFHNNSARLHTPKIKYVHVSLPIAIFQISERLTNLPGN